mgnify:CR=1 FL=1
MDNINNRYREEELEEALDDNVNEDSVNKEEKVEEVSEEPIKKKNKEDKKVNALKETIAKLEDENKKLKEQYFRTLADAENFKKRNDEERIRERKYASQKLIEKLLNDLDIFEKAVNMKTDDPMLTNFLMGFQMINNNISRVLSDEGVKKIKTVGEKFDPRYHNAVETKWNEEYEEDVCLQEMISGYMYKDRVLRAASVVVNKKSEN